MKNVYIECSMLAAAPAVNTGIQRVVRQILQQAQVIGEEAGIRVKAVDLSFGGFEEVDPAGLYPSQAKVSASSVRPAAGRRIKTYLRRLLRSLESYPAVITALYRGLTLARRTARLVTGGLQGCSSDQAKTLAEVSPGDHLIIIDASWTRDIWSGVRKFRAKGGRVTVVIYDLIPLSHARFCEPDHVACFNDWMRNVVREADTCIGISRFVRDELQTYFQSAGMQTLPYMGFFYLGADLLLPSHTDSAPRDELVQHFYSRPVYIMVSTIEPRKNHALVLQAFERIWQQGGDAALLIIGRPGWKVDALLERIRQHDEYGSRLLQYSDLTDSELVWCYQQARALVFASHVEGFGLPLIEAMHCSLPVLASDIPIHHEIAGEQAHYFSPVDPEELSRLILSIESGTMKLDAGFGQMEAHLTWEQSCHMLLTAANILNEKPVADTV